MSFTWSSRWALLLLVGTAALVFGSFYALCTRAAGIAFLPHDGPAEWIVYADPPDHMRHFGGEVETVFRRSFKLGEVPDTARLSLKAFHKAVVQVNGLVVEIAQGDNANWKQVHTADVARYLRKDDNDVQVTVTNASGPPALWLSLTAGATTLNSDREWQASLAGASWEPVRLAAEPKPELPGSMAYEDQHTLPALQHQWPMLLLFAGFSALLCVGIHYATKKWPKLRLRGLPFWPIILGITCLWLALFWNNHLFLPIKQGFDAGDHLNYIEFIQKNKRLPLANEGWEMYQPPLYYLICASVLTLLGLPAKTAGALMMLRVLECVIAVGQVALVFASLRLLFPAQPGRQAVGLVCAAFLPPHLYLSQFVSNEMLAAALGSAAIYFALRVLQNDRPSLWLHGAVGVSLGAALLAKVSTILLVPVIVAVLVGRLLMRRQLLSRAASGVGIMFLVCLLVSGWHYARVGYTFGNPLVGNWDPGIGKPWWQEPGYHTAHSYWAFGRSFARPFRSGLYSVPDGFYSTLWGDGLYSGLGSNRPPWNHELMALGYLLAIVPSLAVIAGACVALVQVLRRPTAEWVLLVGLAALVVIALLYMTLRVPSYAQAKAFYGLFAVVPFAAFAVLGFDLVLSRWRGAAWLIFTFLGVWALVVYLSLWVNGDSPDAQVWLGWASVLDGNLKTGEQRFRGALQVDPHHVNAQVALGATLANSGRRQEALDVLSRALADHPESAECYLALANAEGQNDRAVNDFKKAIALAPDHPTAYGDLAELLLRLGRAPEAIAMYRQAARVTPYNARLHVALARALQQAGDAGAAVRQFSTALNLQPDDLAALENLAWIRATNPDAKLRAGPEALRLAERLRSLPARPEARSLDVLAAAYAEMGRYPQAVETIQKALEVARAAGRADLVLLLEKRLELYKSEKAYRDRSR